MTARSGLDAGDVAPVAVTTRSSAVESVHHGAVVALGRSGEVAVAIGNPDAVVYPRSSLKPLQAQAMVEAGLDVEPDELAVACGSHHGEQIHLETVRKLLGRYGLDETALQNTPAMPLSPDAAAALFRAGGEPTALTQNCSGKHAAMLATSVTNGWPTENYLDVQHPVQRAIDGYLAAAAGGVVGTGVDGCGAPTAMLSLSGIARAMRRLAVSSAAAYRAMVAYPHLVAGTAATDTEVMQALPGVVAKGGAEGFAVAAHRDGWAVAVKIADGSSRARLPVLLAALEALGVDVSAVAVPPILGHGRAVGEVRAIVAH